MLESDRVRYELSLSGSIHDGTKKFDAYRWSIVVNPHQKSREWLKVNNCPLDKEHVNILKDGLDWSQFEWGVNSVKISGEEFLVRKIFWVRRTAPRECTEKKMHE